eukprot:TRINITY_DN24245_c0_g1_i1.p1 TRINITY_DN24245_c0_g1~~TRINITY_DN24245_c0_g1_i1.p1  ORF type:complete len:423 (+),score=136.30 TRINITY_DN24245_c0_g1_i1:71-1270(+)
MRGAQCAQRWLQRAISGAAPRAAAPPSCLQRALPRPTVAGAGYRWCATTSTAGEFIIEANQNNFQEVVQDTSTPILVDFYVDWAQPCKTFKPVLEQVVCDANKDGPVVRLLRVNAERGIGPRLMEYFGVQTVPTTFALWNGQLLDSLVGGAPADAAAQFVQKFLSYAGKVKEKAPAEPVDDGTSGAQDMSSKLATARARTKQGKSEEAVRLYQEALDTALAAIAEEKRSRKSAPPKRKDQKVELSIAQQTAPKALAGLAGHAQMAGDRALTLQLIERVKKEHTVALKELKDVQNALATVELLVYADYGHKPSAHYAELLKNAPADDPDAVPRLHLQLAAALYMESNPKAAVDLLLQVMRKHRRWNDDAAKHCATAIFSLLGAKHEVTIDGRRRMMSYLY